MASRNFPDWSRVQLLEILNEVHRMVFTQNVTNSMRMYDVTTGKDPVLTTTSGTYLYEINTTNGFSNNAWRVTDIYSSDIDEPEDIIKKDATPSNSAIIIFKDNPGNSQYYVKAYRQCSSLITENVQMEVPSSYHLSHIWEGLVGMIEKFRSGRSDRWDLFISKLLPELVLKISENSNGNYNVTSKGY